MRLYIRLSKNTDIIPFNYQQLLTGVVHKWLGENNQVHGAPSLYCFSWLQNTKSNKAGIFLTQNSYFFISAYNDDLIKMIMTGILENPDVFCGSKAIAVQIKETPKFTDEERFFLNSPILIRKRNDELIKHITYKDEEFEDAVTENLKVKLKSVNIFDKEISVKLDRLYAFPKTKLVDYKGIKSKTTLAPLIIKGTPEQIGFAWLVGLGNSTGIGFGALK